jgi:hypothetical protein
MVRVLQERYGLKRREDATRGEVTEETTEPEQVGFAW